MMSSKRIRLARNAPIKLCTNPTNSITEAVVEYCGVLIHPISHSANITPPNQVKLDTLRPNSKPPNPKPDTHGTTTHQIKPWQRGLCSSAGRQLLRLAPGCLPPRNAASTGITATSRNVRVILPPGALRFPARNRPVHRL